MSRYVHLRSTPSKTLAEDLENFMRRPCDDLDLITIRGGPDEQLPFSSIDKLLRAVSHLASVTDLRLQIQGVNLVPNDQATGDSGDDLESRWTIKELTLDDIPSFRRNPPYLSIFLRMFHHIHLLKFDFGSWVTIPRSQVAETFADIRDQKVLLNIPAGFSRLKVDVVDLGATTLRDEPNGHLDCAIALYTLAHVASCERVHYKCYPHPSVNSAFEQYLSTCKELKILELDIGRGSPRYFFQQDVSSMGHPLPSLGKLLVERQLVTVRISGFYVDLKPPRYISHNKAGEYSFRVTEFFKAVFRMIDTFSRPATGESLLTCFLKLDTRSTSSQTTCTDADTTSLRAENEAALFQLFRSEEPDNRQFNWVKPNSDNSKDKSKPQPKPKPKIQRIVLEVLADGTWFDDLHKDKSPHGFYMKLRRAVFREMGLDRTGNGLSLSTSAVKE